MARNSGFAEFPEKSESWKDLSFILKSGGMDLNNVKLDWAPILEGQIKHLESQYPDIPIRKSFAPVIESLNANKIKSRVILSGINVSAYAFVTPSGDFTDRLYGSVGFTSPAFASEDRLGNLLSWLEDAAKAQKKYVMLNEIYNAEEMAEKVMFSRGFRKFIRNRLSVDLSGFPKQEPPMQPGFNELPLRKIKPEVYSDSEFEAYSGTADEILFNAGNRNERIEFTKGLLNGKLGPVIEQASKILAIDSKIVAGSVCTHYRSLNGERTALLADIFVAKSLRRKGIAKSLLIFSLNALKKLGYEECALWVSSENPAKFLYEKTGFIDSETSEIFYYKKP